MRLVLTTLFCLSLLACGGDAPVDKPAAPAEPAEPAAPVGVDHSSPEALAASIFRAAVSGDFEGLDGIAAFDSDGDAKRIAGTAAASPEDQADFRKYFEKGSIVGTPRVNGDRAEVDILFGPDGTRKETFNMVKEDGRWMLESF